MYEDIRNNKIKTGIIVSVFLIVITLIIYYICIAFDLGIISIVIALSFSIITSFISYYSSDKIILAMSNARLATSEENKKLINILEGLIVSSGISVTPKLYIVDAAATFHLELFQMVAPLYVSGISTQSYPDRR